MYDMTEKRISIGEAAKTMGVSIDTLRRWDESGTLKAKRDTERGYRYYNFDTIKFLSNDLFLQAKEWVTVDNPTDLPSDIYCSDSAVFQSRLGTLEKLLQGLRGVEADFSLITSVVGEIGNNSFDHNIGSWPDVRGILFAYDLKKRQIVLADRGLGILATLKRARPTLADDAEALKVAFTEKITGRINESRGNGLKYVKLVITGQTEKVNLKLYFQTGKAALTLKKNDPGLDRFNPSFSFRGCLVLIDF